MRELIKPYTACNSGYSTDSSILPSTERKHHFMIYGIFVP
ncbi:Methyl-accepting chemotaxis protein [Nostoc flagelliforme CCNUN1]|uniref:Methyl-accepting chemotaxis protein n=1 Tax=Nostoc flagelliforme CCNUN1 TaxID=2038116 RepID=A0A2K8SQ72_9NOSO|nr:Methyl-accepting chemotaxis protein [Nostoc flagelliforme CCNUN1]